MIRKNNILDWIIATNISKKNDKKMILEILNEMNFSNFLNEKEKFFYDVSSNINSDQKFEAPHFLQEKRKELIDFLKKDFKKGSICAPTSFGKSYAIKQHIKNNVKSKSLIVTPTLALCNEYFLSMIHDNEFKNKTISMSPSSTADIYVLTPEKLLQLFEFDLKSIFEFVVFDEFYEAFSERYFVFKDAFQQCEKRSSKIVTIFPKKIQILPQFTNKDFIFETNDSATTRKFTKYLLDGNNGYEKYVSSEFDDAHSDGFFLEKANIQTTAEERIIDIVKKNPNKKIIVLTSKAKMYELTSQLSNSVQKNTNDFLLSKIIEYIKIVASNIVLKNGISSGIAYHNGSTDKFLRTLIEVAFEAGVINVLFANSTITKGVNLNPDILIIDQTVKQPKISEEMRKIEFINAVGRAGRTILMKNVVGNVVLIRNKNSKSKAFNDEQLVKINNDEIIKLNEPYFKPIDVPRNIEDAYKKHFIENKNGIELSSNLIDSINNFLSHETANENTSNIDIYKNLISEVALSFGTKYEFEWQKKQEEEIVISYLMRQGYSKLYKKDREYLLSQENSGFNKKGWIVSNVSDPKNKNKGYRKFKEGSWDEDELLAIHVDKYEKIGGFYFSQMLNKCLKDVFDKKLIPEEIRKKYIEKQSEIDTYCSNKKWPTSFSDIFVFNNKTEKIEKYLDEIILEISKIKKYY